MSKKRTIPFGCDNAVDEEGLRVFRSLVGTQIRSLIRSGIVHVEWGRILSFRAAPLCNFKLLDECCVPDYLSLSDFVKLRLVCRDAANLARLSTCNHFTIGHEDWPRLCSIIRLKEKKWRALPTITLECGDDMMNEKVNLFLTSRTPVLYLRVYFFVQRGFIPVFRELPPLVENLMTWDVPEHVLATWSLTSHVTELLSYFVGAHDATESVLTWPLQSWKCWFSSEPKMKLCDVMMSDMIIEVGPSDYKSSFSYVRSWLYHTTTLTITATAFQIYTIIQDCVWTNVRKLILQSSTADNFCHHLFAKSFPNLEELVLNRNFDIEGDQSCWSQKLKIEKQ